MECDLETLSVTVECKQYILERTILLNYNSFDLPCGRKSIDWKEFWGKLTSPSIILYSKQYKWQSISYSSSSHWAWNKITRYRIVHYIVSCGNNPKARVTLGWYQPRIKRSCYYQLMWPQNLPMAPPASEYLLVAEEVGHGPLLVAATSRSRDHSYWLVPAGCLVWLPQQRAIGAFSIIIYTLISSEHINLVLYIGK